MLTALFSSCDEQEEIPSDLAVRLLMLYPDQSSGNTMYIESAGEYDEGYLSREELTYLYCSEGAPDSAKEALDCADDWAIVLSSGTNLFELHVFRVRNRADADLVAKLLYRRVKLFRSYDFYGSVEDEKSSPNLIGGNRLFGGYSYGTDELYGETPYTAANSMVYVKGHYIFLLATPDNATAVKWIENNIANSYF
jgi:hypothetical protein